MKRPVSDTGDAVDSVNDSRVVFVSHINHIVGCLEVPVRKCAACSCKCNMGGRVMAVNRGYHLPTASLMGYESQVPLEKRHLISERDAAFQEKKKP